MVLCWWCCHEISENEYHLPYKYEELKKKFHTCGHFCSWSCAKAYAIETYGLTKGGQMSQLLTLMKKQSTGKLDGILKAPSRYVLSAFGGTMTIEDFRTVTKSTYPVTCMPNETHINHTILKPTSNNVRISQQDTTHKLQEINDSNTINEPLRLKRTKPLKRDMNTLESSLGIIRKKK